MATTVISQIVPTSDGRAMLVKGTVGGVAHLYMRENKPFKAGASSALNLTPQQIAQEYADHYALQVAANTVLASQTVTLPLVEGTSSVAYGATPVAEVGYDQLEITATVDSVSTVISISQKNYLALYGASLATNPTIDLKAHIARLLYDRAKYNVQINLTNADYVASFTTT